MRDGRNGAHGPRALQRVRVEQGIDIVFVIHRRPDMELGSVR